MKEVKCPKCSSVFEMDASGYADIVSQIRGEEFENELKNRLKDLETNHKMKLELAEQTIRSEFDITILNLQNQIENHAIEVEIAEKNALAEIQAELHAKEKQVERLKNEKAAAETNAELEVNKATSKLEKEILELENKLNLAETQKALEIKQLEQTNLVEIKAKDDLIRFKEEEIERVKDMKLKLSTKMVGETLEYCENQFNSLRATAFPNAYFEKDNQVVDEAKAITYSVRQIQMMLSSSRYVRNENENDATKTKKKNEDFFKELDKDRS